MSTFDIILAALLGLGAFKGYQQGLIVEVFSFIAFFLGLFLALELTIPVSNELFGSTGFFEIGAIVVFLALFILLTFLIKAAARLVKSAIDITFFGVLDNILGAVAGVFKWAFILSIVFWVFDSVGLDVISKYSADAIIFPYIVGIGPAVFELLSGLVPLLKDLIDSMENFSKKDSILTLITQKG